MPQTPVNNNASEILSSELPNSSVSKTPFNLDSAQNSALYQSQEPPVCAYRNIAAKTPTAVRELLQTVSGLVDYKNNNNNNTGSVLQPEQL